MASKNDSKQREDSMTSRKRNNPGNSSQEDDSTPAKCAGQVNNGNQVPCSLYKMNVVLEKLTHAGFGEFVNYLKEEKVSESKLAEIAEDDDKLEKLGRVYNYTTKKVLKVKKLLTHFKKENIAYNRKVFNDPIHGHIDLHPLCVEIIDTPEFQRLRYIKQLGNCYFVYPGASHNRFEHSIGVCYLAGQLVRALQRRQPTLDITYKDVLCVEIAGLCHDLGHGPFSHLFDKYFIPSVLKNNKWKHEDASKDMFDHMLKNRNLEKVFSVYDLWEMEIEFIKELFKGRPTEETEVTRRYKEKIFLYEIVANKKNSIDVDKWDYFARDCHMLGIKNNFDHNRCIQFARVIEVDEEKQICFRDKEVNNLFDMFYTRQTLHRRAYQHKVTIITEIMVAEAMSLADDHILFEGKKMSEAINDMEAYRKMTDYVFFQILHSTGLHDDLVKARKILEDVLFRRLYRYIGKYTLDSEKDKDIEKVKKEILAKMESSIDEVDENDLILHTTTFDYGMKVGNPIDSVWFYSKDDPDKAKPAEKDQVSSFIPKHFKEENLLFFCKNRGENLGEKLKETFEKWREEKEEATA